MKSEHRHQLETNWLATRLDRLMSESRPYVSTIFGIIIAVVVVGLIWSYWARSSGIRSSGAWDAYNISIGQRPPNIDALRLAAEENPGTAMQQMADVTWADSQVWIAARDYIYNRPVAMEALDRATSRYQAVIQSTDDERILNRAQLGLARVYEIRGELEKARDEYLKVKGAYAEYAKLQAERLEQPETKETYEWLASAKPPRPRTPMGPGTPGERPAFTADDLGLPKAGDSGNATAPVPEGTQPEGETFDDLLDGLNLDFGDAPDSERYPNSEPAGGLGTPASEATPQDTASPSGQVAPSAEGTPSSTDSTNLPESEQPADSSSEPDQTGATETPQQ
jgi:hypothetical protein